MVAAGLLESRASLSIPVRAHNERISKRHASTCELPPDIPSRTSFIFYFGVDGLGGLDMETDEDENVGSYITSVTLFNADIYRVLKAR